MPTAVLTWIFCICFLSSFPDDAGKMQDGKTKKHVYDTTHKTIGRDAKPKDAHGCTFGG